MILYSDAWKERLGWIYANQELKGQITCDIQMMQTGLNSWLAAGCVITIQTSEYQRIAELLLEEKKKQNLNVRP